MTLLPSEGLAQDPECYRGGNEEQTQANGATPAEPRTPGPPVYQAVLVIVVVVVLVLLETFALVFHTASC